MHWLVKPLEHSLGHQSERVVKPLHRTLGLVQVELQQDRWLDWGLERRELQPLLDRPGQQTEPHQQERCSQDLQQ